MATGAYNKRNNEYEIKPGADLQGADLKGVNLIGANLEGANLSDANLERSNLDFAKLSGAILDGTNLRGTSLFNSNLSGADLRSAVLVGTRLFDSNLSGADLRWSDFRYVCIEGANLEGAKLPDFQIVPEEGSFIAYKKVDTGVIKILIPEDAKRTTIFGWRECRASHVKVLEGSGECIEYKEKKSYKEGEFVYADAYVGDIRTRYTSDIHFFMTRKEAEEYCLFL